MNGPIDTPASLPRERAGRPAPADLAERRAGLAAAVAAGTWRTDPPAEDMRLGGVRALRFRPPAAARGVVLHLHGGGFRLGCPEMSGPFAAALATRCGVEVVCPQYRLAPEHPFPAGLADAREALAVLQASGAAPLILSGDSAGGGLAAALAALSGAKPAPPAALVLLSPWLDLTVTSRSYATNAAADPLFSREAATAAAELYLQGATAEHPLASPLLGPTTGFPPTFISVGAGEVLVEDARGFDAALRGAGVASVLSVVAGMEHTAVARSFDLPGSAETFAALADFIDGILGRAG